MKTIAVPTREQISPANQGLFDTLKKNIGTVPNLYAVYAHSENALGTYLALSGAKTSLHPKEKEVVNLIVSQVNECAYCLAAHTAISKMQGFTEEQIIEIRKGEITFDNKLDALVKVSKSIAENKGHADPHLVENFFAAGYNEGSLIDVVMVIGDKTITNYIFALTAVPIDFPAAPAI
ncbi:carboxymuconolactone decarboxylase family protein [Mucilaginibacter sabulilitoris]|uniref:Carboxymuconolactone decarboxylase family protein n=1 Tax=Mucilaginibacter sabulilitoris TaxID=1173583 RepID=A0ABZ0TNR2_9SPHI|nr:carboxymuconolactone decarboxylase family protein [Mucilaginibacter sabulilitoris]WPU94781.1 carboxymuconolactone decarboxylase family protein [Mucilaginibacter sabulilitoris]